jgi:hypothetical protein
VRHLIFLLVLLLLAGCSSEVAKDTTENTGKDIVNAVTKEVDTTAQNIADAAPYLKEDITLGFWDALESIDILIHGDRPENVPTPAEMRAIQIQQGIESAVNTSVVDTASKVESDPLLDYAKAMAILGQTINEEVNRANSSQPGTTAADGTVSPANTTPPEKKMPTPAEMQKAWQTLSKLSTSPETARSLFKYVEKYVTDNPMIGAKAGIVGPAAGDKLGPKAVEFLSKLNPGEVSDVVRFMKGYLIVQLIDNTEGKWEVGYIYVPEESVAIPSEAPATEAPATEAPATE